MDLCILKVIQEDQYEYMIDETDESDDFRKPFRNDFLVKLLNDVLVFGIAFDWFVIEVL